MSWECTSPENKTIANRLERREHMREIRRQMRDIDQDNGPELTVVDWVRCGSGRPDRFGGLGGFFVLGMRWCDYLDALCEDGAAYAEALRSAILERKLKKTGHYHQNSYHGVPLFSDGTVAEFSFRAWGDIVAATWAEEEDQDYSYLDFYYDPSEAVDDWPTDTPQGKT